MNMNVPGAQLIEDYVKQFLAVCGDGDTNEAIRFQNRIASSIPGKPVQGRIGTVCGLDIAYDKMSDRLFAAGAVFTFPTLELLEETTLADETDFPYFPGLLAFREGPAFLKLAGKLRTSVDIFLFDGHGIAHPRGAGIASIGGLLLDRRSVGCAKTRLIGQFRDPSMTRGNASDLVVNKSVVGKALRTRTGVKPIFVSVGYGISLDKAVALVPACCRGFRIPEPLRKAHFLAKELKNRDSAK